MASSVTSEAELSKRLKDARNEDIKEHGQKPIANNQNKDGGKEFRQEPFSLSGAQPQAVHSSYSSVPGPGVQPQRACPGVSQDTGTGISKGFDYSQFGISDDEMQTARNRRRRHK